MIAYNLELELKSSALVGSGLGFGAEIDSDVVYDEIGLPYIPAKRIKGCLRDAAEEVCDMFDLAGIKKEAAQIKRTFGETGAERSAPVYFSNLYLANHEQIRSWLLFFIRSEKYKDSITAERILDTFTEIRQQTKIADNGVALDHSLRTIRVLRKGLTFRGEVHIETDDNQIMNTLLLACRNFRRFGTKRNRGFGEVSCTLCDVSGHMKSIDLEELCTA